MWATNNIALQKRKTIIVTGANSGIGFQTALALYGKEVHVIVACRSLQNAEDAINEIKKQDGEGTLEPGLIDLSSLQSVKQFADDFKQNHTKLDILVNNAGVIIPPASKTAEGFELQFGINFLGHFALTGLLYPMIQNTPHSRIVTLTSLAYTLGNIDFDNLRLEKEYDANREYSQSKLADLYCLPLNCRRE